MGRAPGLIKQLSIRVVSCECPIDTIGWCLSSGMKVFHLLLLLALLRFLLLADIRKNGHSSHSISLQQRWGLRRSWTKTTRISTRIASQILLKTLWLFVVVLAFIYAYNSTEFGLSIVEFRAEGLRLESLLNFYLSRLFIALRTNVHSVHGL